MATIDITSNARPVGFAAAAIGFVQAVILLLVVFGVPVTPEQAAAITGIVTAGFGVWAARKVGTNVADALYTTPPDA